MPDPKVKVLKSDLEKRQPTDVEQDEIDRRIEAEEPLFDEEREGWVPEEKKEEGEEGETEEEKAARIEEEEEEKKRIIDTPDEDLNDEEIAKKKEYKESDNGGEEEELFDDVDIDRKREMLTDKENALENLEGEDGKSELEADIAQMKDTIKKEEEEVSGNEEEEEIKAYAKDKEITVEEAKEIFKKDKETAVKFNNDPVKIARSYRNSQIEYVKVTAALDEANKTISSLQFESQMSSDFKPEKIFSQQRGQEVTREECVEAYKKSYPGLTAEMEDDAVYDLVKRDTLQKVRETQIHQASAIKRNASVRRDELLLDVPEDVKEYKSDIKKMLYGMPDRQIMSKDFNLEDIIFHTRGKNMDVGKKALKEAEERGYKRGLEQRKIVGIKKSAGSSKTKKEKRKTGVNTHGLTEAEQREALDFFADNDIAEERKYELFADTKEKE